MKRLDSKTVLITGGSGGIGKVTTQKALDEGANVVLVDIDSDALEETKSGLNGNDRVHTITADVSDEEDVKTYVNETTDKFGTIDVFFNNAGIIGDVNFVHKQTYENFQRVLNINAGGVFLGMKHVIPVMREQNGGSIINTSSVDGLRGSPGLSPYSTSKHAVVGLTKTAALENAEHKIRINSIHPSPVGTSMMDEVEKGLADEDAENIKNQLEATIPFGEYAEAEDIANLVIFLGSKESRFITGSQYRIDGGMGAQQ
ncbi:SDR family oxidoreductase [Alkalibacterium psychrotolerans]